MSHSILSFPVMLLRLYMLLLQEYLESRVGIHQTMIVGFQFGIKGNTKVDETIDYIDGVVRESGERFEKVPSKVHMVGVDTLMVEVSKKIMISLMVQVSKKITIPYMILHLEEEKVTWF